MKENKIHIKTKSVCMICDEDITVNEHVMFHKTQRQTHGLCLNCFDLYASSTVEMITENLRKNIRNPLIRCPGTYRSLKRNQCCKQIDITTLYVPNTSSLVTHLFRILYTLSSPHMLMCPNKLCGNVVEFFPDDDVSEIVCNNCDTNWCANCFSSPYHKDMSCIEYEINQNNTVNGKYILEMKTEGLLNFCPSCRAPVTKKYGCNKIYCRCGVKWCFLCSEKNIDYDHFNSHGTNRCANKLWETI